MENFSKHIEQHYSAFEQFSSTDTSVIKSAAEMIANCFLNEGKLYVCGEGLSSFISKYFVSILHTSPFIPRPPLPAISLHSDISLLRESDNAVDIYEKQVSTFATSRDIVVGFINSSNQKQVISALRVAAHNNVPTIGVAGAEIGNIHGVSDIVLNVNSDSVVHVQEIQMILCHILCSEIEHIIFQI